MATDTTQNKIAQMLWDYYVVLSNVLKTDNTSLAKPALFQSFYNIFYHADTGNISFPDNDVLKRILEHFYRRHVLLEDPNEIEEWNNNIKFEKPLLPYFLEGDAINESQADAVAKALSHRLSVIIAPSGNNKTKTILHLMASIVKNGYNVAMVSDHPSSVEQVQEALADIKKNAGENWDDLRAHCIGSTNEAKGPFAVISLLRSLYHGKIEPFYYDYIILDDASQTTTLAGMMAISMARNVILLGNLSQMTPAITQKEVWLNTLMAKYIDQTYDDCIVSGEVSGAYRLEADNNMLGLMIRILPENSSAYAFLPEDDGFFKGASPWPVRVWVYEGNYCKKYINGPLESKYNRRQIEIFLKEELPNIKRDLIERKNTSCCILSPYRGHIYALKEALKKALEGIIQPEEIELHQSFPMFTLNTANKSTFDKVFLLPAEDADWESPWFKKRFFVQEAISRTRQELIVITSSVSLSKDLQQKLVNDSIIQALDIDDAKSENDFMFLKSFFDEVYDRSKNNSSDFTMDYGFKRTQRGFFDQIPQFERARQSYVKRAYREKVFDVDEIWKLIKECSSSYELYTEQKILDLPDVSLQPSVMVYKGVILKDIVDENGDTIDQSPLLVDEKDRLYARSNLASIDFLICKDDNVILAIDVEMESMNPVVPILETVGIPFLCLATNGAYIKGIDGDKSPLYEFQKRIEEALCQNDCKCKYKAKNIDACDVKDMKSIKNTLCVKGVLLDMDDSSVSGLIPYLPKNHLHTAAKRFGVVRACRKLEDGYQAEVYFTKRGEDNLSALDQKQTAYLDLNQYLQNAYDRLFKDGKWKSTYEASFLKIDYHGHVDESMYEDKDAIDYYILKYTWSYAYKYYKIYYDVLKRRKENRESKRIKVLSVGCGNFVDYWSLMYANEIDFQGEFHIQYKGIDPMDWGIENRMGDSSAYEKKKLSEYFRSCDVIDCDILTFPMSITEIAQRSDELDVLQETVKTKFVAKNITLCIALRCLDENLKQDMKVVASILSAFEAGDYKIIKSDYKEGKDTHILALDEHFPSYHPLIRAQIRGLQSGKKIACAGIMENDKYHNYTIIELKRR